MYRMDRIKNTCKVNKNTNVVKFIMFHLSSINQDQYMTLTPVCCVDVYHALYGLHLFGVSLLCMWAACLCVSEFDNYRVSPRKYVSNWAICLYFSQTEEKLSSFFSQHYSISLWFITMNWTYDLIHQWWLSWVSCIVLWSVYSYYMVR